MLARLLPITEWGHDSRFVALMGITIVYLSVMNYLLLKRREDMVEKIRVMNKRWDDREQMTQEALYLSLNYGLSYEDAVAGLKQIKELA